MNFFLKFLNFFLKTQSVYIFLAGAILLFIVIAISPQATIFSVSIPTLLVLWFCVWVLLEVIGFRLIDHFKHRKSNVSK
jgi:hypothetical protein